MVRDRRRSFANHVSFFKETNSLYFEKILLTRVSSDSSAKATRDDID